MIQIKPPPGARRRRKRVGRGPGSGRGKTSGRGEKGQKSRSGSKSKAWFEGGQMPLGRRVPKRGMKRGKKSVMMHHFRTLYQIVNLKQLQRYDESQVVDPSLLKRDGLIKKLELPLKILGDGQLARALIVKAQAFSKSARTKIEASGGKAEVI